jgi:PAS domain S-box-containing protein
MSELSLTSILSNISDYTNDAVIITDAEPIDAPGPRIVYVNPTFTHATGYHAAEVLGKNPRFLQGPDTSPAARQEIRKALQAWLPVVTEVLNYKKDGTPFWSELSIVPIRDDKGFYRYWLSVQRDTTERRQHERDISLRSLAMDATAKAIAVCTLVEDSPKVIYGNRPFTTLLGEAEGSGCTLLRLFPEESRRRDIVEALRACKTQGRTHVSEEPISPPEGGEMFARIAIEPIPSDLVGEPMLLITITDKTEERARQEEMAQAQRLRAIGQVTGGVAHDFNNLLTIVTHCSEILLTRKSLGEDALSLIQTIADTADRAASLTAQLLSFGRRRPLEAQHIELRPFLERVQSVLERVIPSTIAVQLRMEPGLANLKADPAQLETALLNLAINARDAIQMHGQLHGVIRLVAANKTIEAQTGGPDPLPAGDYVSLSVIDNGPGLSEEALQRAFEPFFTTKDIGLGSGLGLSMVYGFAHQSGGHVAITASSGSGATVEMLLPQSRSGPAAISVANDPEPSVDFGSVGVLVVEDTPGVLEQVVNLIRALGCRTYSASSGAEALSLLRDHKEVDLLLTDVVMAGGVNGVALAQAARAQRPNLKVVFTSGYSEEDPEVIRVLSDGAPLLKKPYRSADLAQALRQAVAGG